MIFPSQKIVDESDLNNFDLQVRQDSLKHLMESANTLPQFHKQEAVNLHCHSFYSFNAYGYSPTGLAWLAKKNGYKAMGIVDFDVLDGVEEFLSACECLEIRGCAGLETRTFLPEFATREINSPGEPGVNYYMGVGFSSNYVPPSVQPLLNKLRFQTTRRNREIIERINDYLAPVKIDYDRDVLPLTPAGNPTERHIVLAYILAAKQEITNLSVFWAGKLDLKTDVVVEFNQESSKFQNLVRSKLMKKGGVGYILPALDAFPKIQEINKITLACGAIPCVAWLDGISQGEQDIEELLNLLINQDAAAINIIPERNWNIADTDSKKIKTQKLYEIVSLAHDLDLPIITGTEMNSFGQPLVDNFLSAELQPVHQKFLDGAYFLYGHTIMQRYLGLGYESDWAKSHFPARRQRNQFYQQIGFQIPPEKKTIGKLLSLKEGASPEQFLSLSAQD